MTATLLILLTLLSSWTTASPSSGLILGRQAPVPVDLSGLDTPNDASEYYASQCETFAGYPTGMVDYQLLGYVNGLLIQQLTELNYHLDEMKHALGNQYDPNTEMADLGSYIDGIRAFCGGRTCTDCDCANPDSMCSDGDCSLDATCTSFSELLSLEQALLDAIAVVNPGDNCLNRKACKQLADLST